MGIHNVVHIFVMRKYFSDEEQSAFVDLRGLDIELDLFTKVQPIKIVNVRKRYKTKEDTLSES